MRVIHHLIYSIPVFPLPEGEPEACAESYEGAQAFAQDFLEGKSARITLLVSVNDENRLFQPCPICDAAENRAPLRAAYLDLAVV